MVHADYRRYGIFKNALIKSHEESKQMGLLLVYGFPGPMSLAGFIQKGDWRRIAAMKEYRYNFSPPKLRKVRALRWFTRILGVISSFQNKCLRLYKKARSYPQSTYQIHSKVPEAYDKLWEQIQRYEIYSVWKDSSYLKWRYQENPDSKYTFHTLHSNEQLVAMAVTKRVDDTLEILEFMVKNKMGSWTQYLKCEIQSYAYKNSCQTIKFLGHDDGWFDEVFDNYQSRKLHDQIFCLYPLNDTQSLPGIEINSNWTITGGDWDGV